MVPVLKKHGQMRSVIVNGLDDTLKKQNFRKVWVEEWSLKRDTLGTDNTILTELYYRYRYREHLKEAIFYFNVIYYK